VSRDVGVKKMKRLNTTLMVLIVASVIAGCSSRNSPGINTLNGKVSEPVTQLETSKALSFLAIFNPEMTLDDIESSLGKSDLDCGSAIHDLWYTLDDGSFVRVRATYQGRVLSIERQGDMIDGYFKTIYEIGKKNTNQSIEAIVITPVD
jgi:hypothetical protein